MHRFELLSLFWGVEGAVFRIIRDFPVKISELCLLQFVPPMCFKFRQNLRLRLSLTLGAYDTIGFFHLTLLESGRACRALSVEKKSGERVVEEKENLVVAVYCKIYYIV